MNDNTFNELEQKQNKVLDLSNESETDVLKQVLLIDSGSLAVLGAIVTAGINVTTLPQKILLTITVGFFIFSLFNAILYLTLSHLLFYKAHNSFDKLIKATKLMQKDKQISYFNEEALKIKNSTNKIPFYFSIFSLLISVTLLVVIILLNIW